MGKMSAVVNSTARVEQLHELLGILADTIDQRPGARDLAQLARQYRETLKEIEEIEGAATNGDEIAEIISGREADGKPGAIRPNRAGI